jgi:hypothetical protein
MNELKINIKHIPTDDPIYVDCAKWLPTIDWYIGSSGVGAKLGADKAGQNIKGNDVNVGGWAYDFEKSSEIDINGGGLVTKLNKNGSIKGSSSWETFPDISGVWRSPFGWDDESCMRRAPKAWALFDRVNKLYFNNSLTLDGFPEEIGATRSLWSTKYGEDNSIPGYGTLPKPGDMNPIWTSYAIGKTGGVLFEGINKTDTDVRMMRQKWARRSGSVGIHRDAAVDVAEDADGYFSMLINMNLEWKPSWGGELLYFKTIDPEEASETHWKRGYGIGYPSVVTPHEPGSIILCPAAALHTTANDKYLPKRSDYLRRLMFRCRYKDLLNDDFEGT